MKLDSETQQVLLEGDKIIDFVKSEGWQNARRKLYTKLITVDSISSIPDQMDAAAQLDEMRIRRGAISLVLDWIKEIEGSAQQAQNNKHSLTEIRQESIIEYF